MSRSSVLAVAVCCAALLSACGEPDETPALNDALTEQAAKRTQRAAALQQPDVNPRLLRRFQPLRSSLESPGNPLTNAKIALGRMLFFEPRLSKGQTLSCNSCHRLARYGADEAALSLGHAKQRGHRNTPTVYNAAGFFAQFWDGRATSVEEQALVPILNPTEMALPSGDRGVKVLESMPEYQRAFKDAFPGDAKPVTFENAGRAIGAFERRLTTPSRWDDYLRGNARALNAAEIDGLKVFTDVGCMVCHTGEFLGGSMYQKVGVVEPWPNQSDQGRFEVTKQEVDRMMFKVPTLRNIAQTAPYFHDGSAATLEVAVEMMGKHQLGLALSSNEVSSIVAWLGSLTGSLPTDYIEPPTLPPSTSATPPAEE